jgi:hypothetical protein
MYKYQPQSMGHGVKSTGQRAGGKGRCKKCLARRLVDLAGKAEERRRKP